MNSCDRAQANAVLAPLGPDTAAPESSISCGQVGPDGHSESEGPCPVSRYERLARTSTLAGDALRRWQARKIAIIGEGAVGSRLTLEVVRSGATVLIFDPDTVSFGNLGTQAFETSGVLKVEAIRRACEAIRPGAAAARPIDVRHAGPGELATADALVDCSDDGALESWLTATSNGLGIPLIRVALDGSGERELGRVQVSHGGGGAACRLCAKSLQDVLRQQPRTPCPGSTEQGRAPTLAGNAIAMVVSGLALLQLQRLLGGVAAERVLGSQVIVDLDRGQLLDLREERQEHCPSGHITWALTPTELSAEDATFGDLFVEAARLLGQQPDTLECYGHALHTSAQCESCASAVAAVGSRWAQPPRCSVCGAGTTWELHTATPRWTWQQAQREKILGWTASQLGLPLHGAMLIARRQGLPPMRFLLR